MRKQKSNRYRIFRFCQPFIWFILFNFLQGCLNPVNPPRELVSDIYIGCVLQTGNGNQYVYVNGSTSNPEQVIPADSTLFLADATVILSGENFTVTLSPDTTETSDSVSRARFSTNNQKIQIQPESFYELSVHWHGREFTARTQTPVAPKFEPVDSLLLIYDDEFGYGKIFLNFRNPQELFWYSVDYPFSRSYLWGGSGRGFESGILLGSQVHLTTGHWDSTGVATVVVYSWNEDYENSRRSAEELAHVDIPQKHFSNISGAHGVFAAMANDSLVFRYQKVKF